MSRKTRKLIWAVPLVAVFAVVGALAIFAAQPANPAEAHGIPGPVNDLKAEATGRHTIMLSWSKPTTGGDPTGYRVDQSKDNRVWSVHTADTGSTATSLEITEGVTPATRMHFRVFALNSAGTGPVSEDPVTAFVDVNEDHPPVAPSGPVLTATVKGHNQIDLTWTEPTYNGGADVSAYNLRWMVTSADAAQTATDTACGTPEDSTAQNEPCLLAMTAKTDDRAYSHKGLQAGETYYYQVSVTAGGGTTYSNVVGETTLAVANPSRPQDLVAVPSAETTIQLYWNEPASNGGHAVVNVPAGADLQYKFKPSADNTGGTAINTWTNIEATVCPATDGCNVTVAADGGNGSYEFRLRARQNNTPEDVGLNQASSYVTSRAVTLPFETGGTENRKQPGQPTLTATVLEATTETGQGIRLTWEEYDDSSDDNMAPNPDDYRIDFARVPKPDTGDNTAAANPGKWMRLQYFLITLGEYEHEGLASGDRYFYRILAKNGNHYGTAGIADGIVTAAVIGSGASQGSPLTLTATALSATKIKLDWTAMPGVTNARYCVQAAPILTTGNVGAAGVYAALTSMPIASLTYTDTLDGPGSEKWYRVYREGGADTDCGAPSATAPIDTVYPPQRGMTPEAGSPGKPFGLVVEEAKDSSLLGPTARGVLLLWAEPTEKDMDIVTGYEVQRMIDGSAWTSIVRDTSKPTAAMGQWTHHNDMDEIGTVSGHADEKQRAYRVRALSGNGKGDWSDTAYYPPMHTADTRHNTAPTAGAAIANQTVVAGMTVMVQSTITDSDMDDTLDRSVASDMDMYATAEVDDMGMVTITGVAAGTATITVTATDMDGEMATQDIMVTVTAAELGMASNLAIGINTGGTIQVTWDEAPNALGYIVIAVQKGDRSVVVSDPVNPDDDGVTATTLNLGGLTIGNEYRVFVAATGRQGENTLSDFTEVTAQ